MIGAVFSLTAALVSLAGAVGDLRQRRLPNALTLLLAAASLGAAFATGGWSMLASGAMHAGLALVVGMALFALGAIGAGDAKFYTAAAFAVPLSRAAVMLGWVSLAGLVVFALMMLANRGMKHTVDGVRKSWLLPYGVPIALGFIATIRPWAAFS